MAVSAAFPAFAQGGFVSSPSANSTPTIVKVVCGNGSCNPDIVITPYSERNGLDKERKENINTAYAEIASSKTPSQLCEVLATFASEKGVVAANLAVSDLFDVTAYHNGNHDYCGTIKITLSVETAKRFVALLHRNSKNGWEMISDVVVNAAENTIEFSATDFSPFAIVVDTSVESLPDTGQSLLVPAIVMLVSATAFIVVVGVKKNKKQKAHQ